MKKVGILLNNIGTPNSFSPKDVKPYLREFLMDPDVISLPRPLRDFLVKGLIVPFRAQNSAAKYKKIWMAEGSPLKVYSDRFAEKLQRDLGERFVVRFGMSYGSPSIPQALQEMREAGVQRFHFIPLFPQWSEATMESAFRRIKKETKGQHFEMHFIREFYARDFFLNPQIQLIQDFLKTHPVDHVIFSYHSLPESQVKKQKGCLASHDCCYRVEASEKPCYRAQCIKTSKLLAEGLSLPKDQWTTAFQSRLGPAKWIGPSTLEITKELAGRGVKRLAVACPSFVADCLETLEEIGLELRKEFITAGGEEFHLIPCLNDEDQWVQSFADELRGISN